MTQNYEPDNRACRRVRAHLSEYLNGGLRAHQALAVERHLQSCTACASCAQDWHRTVDALRTAPRRDTSGAFMARLHARLDAVEGQRTTTSRPWGAFRDALDAARALVGARRLPALGLSFAAVAAIGLFIVTRPPAENPASLPGRITSESLRRDVALAASNPFDDPVAASIEARTAMDQSDSGVNDD